MRDKLQYKPGEGGLQALQNRKHNSTGRATYLLRLCSAWNFQIYTFPRKREESSLILQHTATSATRTRQQGPLTTLEMACVPGPVCLCEVLEVQAGAGVQATQQQDLLYFSE